MEHYGWRTTEEAFAVMEPNPLPLWVSTLMGRSLGRLRCSLTLMILAMLGCAECVY